MTMQINDGNIDEFIQSDEVVLVDFFGTWCGPCKMVAPALEKLSEDFTIGKIDIDENPDSVGRFGVMSVPTMLIFKNGEVVDKIIGFRPKDAIEEALKNA